MNPQIETNDPIIPEGFDESAAVRAWIRDDLKAMDNGSGGAWLIDGVLPSAGLTLLEAETMDAADIVADELAFTVASAYTWAGRRTLPGIVARYYVEGGRMRVARLYGDAPGAEAYGPDEIRMVVAQLGHCEDVGTLIDILPVARHLKACALIVATSDHPDIAELRKHAGAILHAGEHPRQTIDGRPVDGAVTLVKGGARASWQFSIDAMEEFVGADPARCIDELWECRAHVH